jgi:hypothetical protein
MEVDEARTVLRDHKSASGRFLSLPFGMEKDFGRRVKEYAIASGYEFVFEVGDGWNPLFRVNRDRSFARTCLGNIENAKPARLYSALELRPILKGLINTAQTALQQQK